MYGYKSGYNWSIIMGIEPNDVDYEEAWEGRGGQVYAFILN